MKRSLAISGFITAIALTGVASHFSAIADGPTQSSRHAAEEFHFIWQEVESVQAQKKANINQANKQLIFREQKQHYDPAAETKLQQRFNIDLSNTNTPWTPGYASQLLSELQDIARSPELSSQETPSHWILTSSYIHNDIQMLEHRGEKTVVISTSAFKNASALSGFLNQQAGSFVSKRLHHALVRYVTNNGKNIKAADSLLRLKFGVSIIIDDYKTLTRNVTNESANRFQAFHSNEVVELINMFEEMPDSMHRISGLRFLARRLDGTPHPTYPQAPAVAWTNNGYIEFMESAFTGTRINHLKRLIIHEKVHFLWSHAFTPEVKADWISLGAWQQKAGTQGWRTTQQTEFVSAYAHGTNPDEDMAESLSYYMLAPDILKSRALKKYDFIRTRIMDGDIFISQIREDLTYQVKNLDPDYIYPGKIESLEVRVLGAPSNDKQIQIDVILRDKEKKFSSATRAYLRIFSDYDTYFDAQLQAVDETGNTISSGHHLRATTNVSRFVRSGYWSTNQIVIIDEVGNQRFERAEDFGWMLFINNPFQDLNPPEYVPRSARLIRTLKNFNGRAIQTITARWEVSERIKMGGFECYASLNDDSLDTYRQENYGSYEPQTKTCEVDFPMPDYMPSGTYTLAFLKMSDAALNTTGIYFSDPSNDRPIDHQSIDESPPQIKVRTRNPDLSAPILDLNNIKITAKPTNPSSPNGETQVTVVFKIKDDIAGFDLAAMYMRDPQGIVHFSDYVQGEAKEQNITTSVDNWHTISKIIILPAGSAPGTWGLSEMYVRDKAGNFRAYDFTEIIHFDVE